MSRILNRQRQMAEQGRLRLGYTVPGDKGPRPIRSETWILTSHSREHIEAAAALWGGDVEKWQPMGHGHEQFRVITKANTIDAFLPPGDPLTQAYEQWGRGGCVVRCDGVTEQFSGSPCLCLTKYGEQWYERSKDVCDSKSRLKVMLPDMPGLGVWRMETGSYYATDEIAGMVDTIRAAVGGAILVPVRLRIEQRTRVAGGQTKQFVVPVLDLRGVTAGALLAGQVDMKSVETPTARKAIESGKPADDLADYMAAVAEAEDAEALMAVYEQAKAAGVLGGNVPKTHPLYVAISERHKALSADQSAGDEVDPDAVWRQILERAGQLGMTQTQLEEEFAAANQGVVASAASAGELAAFLRTLQERAA